MNFRWVALLASTLAIGCSQQAPATPVQKISFSAGSCFGPCPVFSFSVDATGQGMYDGQSNVAVQGSRRFRATPQQFKALVERLAPYRPSGEEKYDTNCDGPWATDNPSVRIVWSDGKKLDILYWYLGCQQPGLIEHVDKIYGAWRELPTRDLVGTAEDRFI